MILDVDLFLPCRKSSGRKDGEVSTLSQLVSAEFLGELVRPAQIIFAVKDNLAREISLIDHFDNHIWAFYSFPNPRNIIFRKRGREHRMKVNFGRFTDVMGALALKLPLH